MHTIGEMIFIKQTEHRKNVCRMFPLEFFLRNIYPLASAQKFSGNPKKISAFALRGRLEVRRVRGKLLFPGYPAITEHPLTLSALFFALTSF